jgi:hypothetical protein
MTRKSKIGKGIGIFLCVIVLAAVFTFIVMSLWNAILPAVLGVKTITFWQALGILILSKILFGGFGGGKGGGHWKEKARSRWRDRMENKWENMSPEDREKFKSSWEARCGGSWRRPFGGRRFEGFSPENKEAQPEKKGEAGAE